MPSQLQVTSC